MNIVVSDGIVVSGVGAPLNGITWPSGLFGNSEPGSQLCAFLSSANSTFGFNISPHSFQTEWVPCGDACAFHGASGQLPDVGHAFELYIGDFFFRGKVTHADYTSSGGGTVVNVTVEDDRRELRKVKLHSEDLGDDVPSGVVSIARGYRIVNGLTDINGDPSDPMIKEYNRILQFGGTYSQILVAIDNAFNEGRLSISSSELPTVQQLEKNIGGTIEAIRFQFNLTLLDEAITRILSDTGYDWYWNMDAQQLNLINRKSTFDISENDILDLVSQFGSASGLNETRQLGFGQDVVPDPTRFRVLGGHQEGIINSALLSPIDGLDTSAFDGNVVFDKVWDRLSVGFYDSDGFYRTYIPTEKELQMALAGIEQWCYFKIYQTTAVNADPPGFGLAPDLGSQAAQDPTFQSRLDPLMPLAGLATGAAESGIRIISNRRDEENNWVIAFFNRLQDHSSRHYGRSYVLENLIYNDASGLFRPIEAAWANVDNQVQGFALSASGTLATSGIFLEDYEINRDLGPMSPFVANDFRVRAHCVLPADTVYGPQGDAVPASFGNWTEDAPPFNPNGDGKHYIPVGISIVGQRVINPRADDLYAFESFPEGTLWCQLPINAGASGSLVIDPTISSLATLLTTNQKLTGSGLLDIINPGRVLNVYDSLSGVALPVESRTRYGQSYPSQWVLGDLHYERDEDIQLDDQFVPWGFSPDGSQTSLQIMTERAVRRAQGKIVNRSSSRYADFSQIGLPLLSFDAFATQGIGPSGLYGEVSHGVSELNISFGGEGFATHYKIQSFFPKFGREAPLGERVRAQLNGIINPVDFTDLELLDQTPLTAQDPLLPGNPLIPPFFFDDEQRAVKVTINSVANIFTLSSAPGTESDERYRGIDQNQYVKPPSLGGSSNPDFNLGAICIDGFLNIGDQAMYHTDEFELPGGSVVQRYFTQGRAFGQGTIVQIERVNPSNSAQYDVTIVDPTASALGTERAIFGTAVLSGSVAIGDKTTIAVQGDAPVKPGVNNDSIFVIGTTSEAAGVTPVEVVSVSNAGTAQAIAICRPLDADGNVVTSGTRFPDVIPIPFRELAASGDRGYLASVIVGSGSFGVTADRSFVTIARDANRRYG